MVKLELKVDVLPKGRARFRIVNPKRGKSFVVTYTPVETETNQKVLQWNFKDFMRGKVMIDKNTDVRVNMQIYTTSPRGDIDNFIKQIFDSANKILWHDDRQVKQFGEVGLHLKSSKPRLYMTVEPLIAEQMIFGGTDD